MMAKAPKKADLDRAGGMVSSWDTPIGASPDGGLNIVDKDSPPFKPKVFDEDGNEIDPDAIEPDAPADE